MPISQASSFTCVHPDFVRPNLLRPDFSFFFFFYLVCNFQASDTLSRKNCLDIIS